MLAMYKSSTTTASGKKKKSSNNNSNINNNNSSSSKKNIKSKYGGTGYSSDHSNYSNNRSEDDDYLHNINESEEYNYESSSPDSYSNSRHQNRTHSNAKSNYYSSSQPTDYYNYKTGNYSSSKHHQSTTKAKEPSYKLNKYQTIVFKVQVHCDACIRKVKKAIAGIDGVESIVVDAKQKKVSVTGYIDPKKIVKKVSKSGKHIEMISASSNNNTSSINSSINHHMMINSKPAHSDHATYAIVDGKNGRGHHHLNNNQNNINTNRSFIAPHFRSGVEDMFSEDNVNSCSIM